MVSALTGSGTSSLLASTSSLGTVQIAARMYSDMREKTDVIEENYDYTLQSLQATQGTLTGRQQDLEAVQQAVENGKEQVTEVRMALLELRTLVNRAENNPESSDYYKAQFNEKIKEINAIADQYADRYNLVGNVDQITLLPDAKTVQASDFAVDTVFQAEYLGTTFNIIGTGDSEGIYYENWPTANMMQAVEYIGGDDLESGAIYHNSDRITNVSMSGDEISFTLDDSTTVTGTLETGGLGLMPSWFYDDFTDFDGIRDAIRDAEDHLREVSGSLVEIQVTADSLVSRVERDLADVTEEIAETNQEKEDKVSAIEEETRSQYEAIENSLSQAADEITRYKTIFQNVSLGPFTDILA